VSSNLDRALAALHSGRAPFSVAEYTRGDGVRCRLPLVNWQILWITPPTERLLRGWWADYPDAVVGIVMPDGEAWEVLT
jgi:hypothetical protein